jgi:ElaB/YqjD/DUF883 family membrane-anchored ribosome-binding protein
MEEKNAATNQTSDQIKAAAADFTAAANKKAEDIRRAAEQKAEELQKTARKKASELQDHAQTAWSDARVKAETWHSSGEAYIRQNPTQSVLIALGAGFVIGLLLRK